MDKEESFCNSTCEDQINMAARELSAFICAITKLFGAEQAKCSTEDWLDELDLKDSRPRSTVRDWRALSVAASARLAKRLIVAQHPRNSPGIPLARPTDTKVPSILSSHCLFSTLPAFYPDNGRTLTDDVVDFFLPLLTNRNIRETRSGP